MGDVGGVSQVIGTINSIPVTWYFADNTVLFSKTFTDGKKFAESTNLIAIPVIITATITDAGSGIDFATLKGSLNGTTFFNGAAPPAVPPAFPEKLEIIVGGVPLKNLNQSIVTNSAFTQIDIKYHPSAPKLITGSNTVVINQVKDKTKNQQGANTVQTFTFP